MPSYLLITNPFSGRGLTESGISGVVTLFAAAGGRVDVVHTRGPGDAGRAVGDPKRDYSGIVVAGGDGTINEVVNGLDGRRVPIGIVPCGTGNVLAKELEIPRRTKKAVAVILSGKELPLDVGLAGERRFMLMGSAGYDAQVVAEAHRKRTHRFGFASFLLPMWRVFRRGAFPEITVEMHGHKYTCRHVVVANVPSYGGPFRPVPHAIYNDGEFDVVIFQRPGRWNMLRYGRLALFASDAERDNDIIRMRSESVTLSSGEPVGYQLDGDPAGNLPCSFRVKRDGATFFVP